MLRCCRSRAAPRDRTSHTPPDWRRPRESGSRCCCRPAPSLVPWEGLRPSLLARWRHASSCRRYSRSRSELRFACAFRTSSSRRWLDRSMASETIHPRCAGWGSGTGEENGYCRSANSAQDLLVEPKAGTGTAPGPKTGGRKHGIPCLLFRAVAQQIRPQTLCLLACRIAPEFRDLGVIAVQQHLRHLPAAEFGRPRPVRAVEQPFAVPGLLERFERARRLIAQ